MMKTSTSVKETDGGFLPRFTSVVINVLICYGLTLACLLVFAFVITYTGFPESFAPVIVLALTALSIILAGILTARGSRSKGWLSGAIAGTIYMVTLYCIGSLIFRSVTFGFNVVAMLALGLFSGAFGGMIGINIRQKR